MTHFCSRDVVDATLRGRRVALVGSGPGVLENPPGFIDGHEVVVRVNNWKLGPAAGQRTDVFYSFFGGSIRKTAAEARAAGVQLCMCKCPDAKFMDSPWHQANNKPRGVDFRFIYRERAAWWFCPTWVPPLESFLAQFDLLAGHVPTTGFSAVLDMLASGPAAVYLTGFDFFTSGVHNTDEPWRAGRADDPIGHRPERELQWLREHITGLPVTVDRRLQGML